MPEKTNAQKLLIKSGNRLRFINPPDDLKQWLGDLPDGIKILDDSDNPALYPLDAIILFANNRAELETFLPDLRGMITPDSKMWVAYHKGTSQIKTDINRDSINAYAQTLGMEGIAIVSMNNDWSALRLKMVG